MAADFGALWHTGHATTLLLRDHLTAAAAKPQMAAAAAVVVRLQQLTLPAAAQCVRGNGILHTL